VLFPRLGLTVMIGAVLAAGTGCGTSATPPGPGSAITPAAGQTRAPSAAAERTDVPEPATAPPAGQRPAGRVVALPGGPEGLAVDARDGLLAAGIRQPAGVALVDTATGRERRIIRLAGAPRHLELAGPAGPLLVPLEDADQLAQIALPGGEVTADTAVGRHPHDAAADGSLIFVGNEYASTVSVVRDGRQVRVEPGPLQPGGVAAGGSFILVVGVRGRRVEAYSAAGRILGTARAGAGPTHVQAGRGGLFYVADTEGNAVLIFRVDTTGPRQVGTAPTERGTPYGIAVDRRRGLVYVTLTATNQLESFRISGSGLVPDQTWPTVRQPNSVAVDESTGRVFIAGRAGSQLELINPGTRGTPVPH
jgi:DNA-binding beta-propeller fold protein YncE